jgi:hypothetical protein
MWLEQDVKELQRRLRKLEQRVEDPSGFPSHTQKWREHWHDRIRAYMSDDYDGPRPPRPLFPLEA